MILGSIFTINKNQFRRTHNHFLLDLKKLLKNIMILSHNMHKLRNSFIKEC
jgi:hypothetical protein